jgi:integrase
MAVDDLWFLKARDPGTGKRLPSKRHGRGMRWRVRYQDDGGAKVEKLFEKEHAAKQFDASVRSDVDRGLYIDPAAGRVTVERYSKTWRESQLHRGSTSELIEGTFRRHINPVLGRMSLSSVRSTHVQSWVKGVDLAPSTTRIAYSYLVAMFGAAVIDRAIAVSPCVGITLPTLETSEHVILTPAQVHTLAETVHPRYRALVYIGAGCGLRIGEACGLEVEHVDFLRREITVTQQLTVTSGRSPFLAPPKTVTSRRTVELPKVTGDALAQHMVKFPPVEVELIDEIDRRKPVERSVRLMFTNAKERPIHRASWSHYWSPAARAAELPARTGFHSLRHYFATVLIHGGASVKTVQLALGHSTPMVTLNIYTGHWPDQIDRTRTLLDQALGAVPEQVTAS